MDSISQDQNTILEQMRVNTTIQNYVSYRIAWFTTYTTIFVIEQCLQQKYMMANLYDYTYFYKETTIITCLT